jgi:SpoVK/Ycf46/Vps4 family AAA+-type ATPase
MSKWIGESEDNLAKALKLAETVSPCVLWMDEFDKAIPSLTNNQTHEVTKRMMSTLLTWLQEKKEKIFVVATANNIHHLPPEIMRKGRFDEIFFIDLPNGKEREQIFSIHVKKKGLDESLFDLGALAKETDGFSGAEIESVVNEACVLAACESQMVMQHHLLQEIQVTNPISETMEQDVAAIRLWAIAHNVRKAN